MPDDVVQGLARQCMESVLDHHQLHGLSILLHALHALDYDEPVCRAVASAAHPVVAAHTQGGWGDLLLQDDPRLYVRPVLDLVVYLAPDLGSVVPAKLGADFSELEARDLDETAALFTDWGHPSLAQACRLKVCVLRMRAGHAGSKELLYTLGAVCVDWHPTEEWRDRVWAGTALLDAFHEHCEEPGDLLDAMYRYEDGLAPHSTTKVWDEELQTLWRAQFPSTAASLYDLHVFTQHIQGLTLEYDQDLVTCLLLVEAQLGHFTDCERAAWRSLALHGDVTEALLYLERSVPRTRMHAQWRYRRAQWRSRLYCTESVEDLIPVVLEVAQGYTVPEYWRDSVTRATTLSRVVDLLLELEVALDYDACIPQWSEYRHAWGVLLRSCWTSSQVLVCLLDLCQYLHEYPSGLALGLVRRALQHPSGRLFLLKKAVHDSTKVSVESITSAVELYGVLGVQSLKQGAQSLLDGCGDPLYSELWAHRLRPVFMASMKALVQHRDTDLDMVASIVGIPGSTLMDVVGAILLGGALEYGLWAAPLSTARVAAVLLLSNTTTTRLQSRALEVLVYSDTQARLLMLQAVVMSSTLYTTSDPISKCVGLDQLCEAMVPGSTTDAMLSEAKFVEYLCRASIPGKSETTYPLMSTARVHLHRLTREIDIPGILWDAIAWLNQETVSCGSPSIRRLAQQLLKVPNLLETNRDFHKSSWSLTVQYSTTAYDICDSIETLLRYLPGDWTVLEYLLQYTKNHELHGINNKLCAMYSLQEEETGRDIIGQQCVSLAEHEGAGAHGVDLMYGEVLQQGVATLFHVLDMKSASLILDLGSGIGKLPIQVYESLPEGTKGVRVVGVEMSLSRCKVAWRAAQRVGGVVTDTGVAIHGNNTLELVQGNLFDYCDLLSVADVVILQTQFPRVMMPRLMDLVQGLKPGARVLTYDNMNLLELEFDRVLDLSIVPNTSSIRLPCSWAPDSGHHLFLYTHN